MVNAVFEEAKRPDIEPDANTARFLAAVPDYLDHGIRDPGMRRPSTPPRPRRRPA
jgi:hypothetical protein